MNSQNQTRKHATPLVAMAVLFLLTVPSAAAVDLTGWWTFTPDEIPCWENVECPDPFCIQTDPCIGEPPETSLAEIGVLPESSGINCQGEYTLEAEGSSSSVVVGGGMGLFWGFVAFTKQKVEVKTAFRFECNTEIGVVATGAGGAYRRVDLYRDGMLTDSRSYSGITPQNSAKAFYRETYSGGSGHGILDVGEELPIGSKACTSAVFHGENKEAITGLDVVSAVNPMECLTVSISWREAQGDAAEELLTWVEQALS